MKRIGLFGGSFDPPHVGHLRIAESVQERFALSEIRWIPAFVPPHKTLIQLSDASDRLEMTRLATAGIPGFTVSEIELYRRGTSYTVDTLRRIRADEPETNLFMIIGQDSFDELDTWKEPEEICSLAELVVYPRAEGRSKPGFADGRIHLLDEPMLPISSTLVRTRIANNESIEDLVTESVAAYIRTRQLYLSG